MAEHRVSSWKDFVNAYTEPKAANETQRTIEIMTDLDCNDMLFSDYIISPADIEMTINGNQHNIWNISTESVINGALIRGGAQKPLYWNKINFGNINRIENSTIFSGYSSTYSMVFNECTFVGKGFSISNNSIFNKCAITWTGVRGNGVIAPYTTFNNCWLHFEITRMQNNSVIELNALNSSYLEGKIEGANANITTAGAIVSTISNSVINIESDLSRTIIVKTTTTTDSPSIFNTTKLPNSTSPDNMINIIGVTDDQMKDANYLSSVGFNILT